MKRSVIKLINLQPPELSKKGKNLKVNISRNNKGGIILESAR